MIQKKRLQNQSCEAHRMFHVKHSAIHGQR